MKRAFIYSIIFVVVFVVWGFSCEKPSEIFMYLSDFVTNKGESIAYAFLFEAIQWVIVFIFIYGWLKRVYSNRSTFFRGIVFSLLIGLSTNSIFGLDAFLFFSGKAMVPMLAALVGFKWLVCFITAQIFAFTYDQLMDRFLKPNVNHNALELSGVADQTNQIQSSRQIIKKIFSYTIIFVVGFFILNFPGENFITGEMEKSLKETIKWDTKIEGILRVTQQVIGFIWSYALLKKVLPSRSTFFRGIVIGLLIGMSSNAMFGLPFLLFWGNVPFGLMMFIFIVLMWFACLLTGQVIAFTYDRLVDRFLERKVSGDTAEL